MKKTPLQVANTVACILWVGAGLAVHAATTPISTNAQISISLTPKLGITNAAGTTVEVLYRNSPASGGWIPLTNFVVSANYFLDLTAPPNGSRYYQVVVLGNTVSSPPSNTSLAPIPAGNFVMGDVFDGSSLPHTNFISAFSIETNLVSLALWQQVYQWATAHNYAFDNAGVGKGSTYPVETISWYDAAKWCNARSEMAGLSVCYFTDGTQATVYRTGRLSLTNGCVNWNSGGYRLPTEAEWEKAAKGGHNFRFPLGNTISESQASYDGNPSVIPYDVGPGGFNPIYGDAPAPVGSFAPNGYGLRDMAGNVQEWCWDWYSSTYYLTSPTTDPRGPNGTTGNRVYRGGAFNLIASALRCANRGDNSQAYVASNTGFRCVQSGN